MLKLKRLRRREAHADVHSEDEEEFDVTRGVLEFSDISDSEVSCEDSDVDSEASHSEGEEETQEETKEESCTMRRGELSLTKEKDINSVHENALAEDTISTSSEFISEIVTKSKGTKKPIATSKQKLKIDDQLEIKQGENDSIAVIRDSDVSSTDGAEELQSHLGGENEAQDEKRNDAQDSVSVPEMSGWQKKVLARQEYRKKLAEDPAFVPHLGEFWGHDDRFIKDEFKDDFDSNYRPFASRGKGVWGNSPPRGRWDHDGFEELMRIEDEERHRKEFQRRIQHRREFIPPTPRRSHFHNNVTPHSRPSNSIRRVRNSFEEQSRSRGMFLPKYDTRNKGENINSNNFNHHHKSSVRESRSENSKSGKITSTAKDNSFLSKGGNGFRGRGYSSRHYMRSSLNRDHSFNTNETDGEVDVRHNTDQDKKPKEQHLNGIDVDNIKDSHVVHNSGQNESQKNEFEDNINTVAEYQTDKVESTQESTDVTSHVNVASSSFTKERVESGSLIENQGCVYEKSNKESEVDIILDSQSRKAIIDNETNSISRSINNVTSSFNDLSINNNPPGSLPSTLTDKDRVQTNQASKRYSTRRATSSSITQPTQANDTNDSLVSGASEQSRTSEIPPSAIFAPPFQPRALALSDENSISNEDPSNNFFPQKPETPAYYMDNIPQGLRNNDNNLPQQTSIPTPAPYVTESNGMVYYYDPNVYYYYYPTHSTPELKDTNDNSVKSSSFVPQHTTNVQENNGVYYYYPIYYQ